MSGIVNFMESPLVTWVTTFSPVETIDYHVLCDGLYLIDVLQQIDEREWNEEVNRVARDSNAQLHNWKLLLSRIHSYYKDVLQHVVVMKLPDILSVIKEPCKDSSVQSVHDVLLLLLGCAVLCDEREDYIEQIKQLDLNVQTGIVDYIKQITDSNTNVIGLETSNELSETLQNFYNILNAVTTDRDVYAQSLFSVTQERDYFRNEAEGRKGPLSPPSGLEMYHLSKEIKQFKTTVNSLTQENEEKSRQIIELRDDNDRIKDRLLALKTENFSLLKDAKSARHCRDELDALKEKALKADKYENDIVKYKELIVELDYYKSQIEDIRNENNTLSESQCRLKNQLTTSTKRVDTLMDELVRNQMLLEEANNDKEQLQRKYQDMSEEHAMMELERSNLANGFTGIKRMLSNSSIDHMNHVGDNPKSFSEEMNNSLSVHLARLESENRDLSTRLESTEQKLTNTNSKREQQREHNESMYRKRVNDLESQVRDIRQRMTRELSQDFAIKVKEVEDKGRQLKNRLADEFRVRTDEMNAKNGELQRKVRELEERNMRHELHACDTREKLEQEIVDLRRDKEHLQAMVNSVQRQSTSRLHTLQRQVSELGTQANSLQRSNEKIHDLCSDLDTEKTPRNSVDLSPTEARMTRSLCSRSELEQPHPRRNRISYVDDRESGSSQMSVSFDDNVFTDDDQPGTLTRSQSLRPVRSQGTRTSPQCLNSTSSAPVQGRSATSTPAQSRSTSPSVHKQKRSSGWGASSSSLNHPNNHPVTPVPVESSSTPFNRSHSFRAPVTPSRSSSSSKSAFSRNDVTRQSMPEPRRTVHVAPEQRKRTHNPPVAKVRPASNSSRKDSGFDSGHASPDGSRTKSTIEQILSTITSVTTTQTVKQHSFKMPKLGDKYKILVTKIVELQDRNQQLVLENSEIRRVICDIRYSVERIDSVEKKNIELEVENRRLRRICESLQGVQHNVDPRDSPYHYYSSV